MSATQPTDRTEPGPTRSDFTDLSPGPRDPSGGIWSVVDVEVPAGVESVSGLPGRSSRSEPDLAEPPRPPRFPTRHAVGIGRTFAVILVVVGLLFLWEEEAGGQDGQKSAGQVAVADEPAIGTGEFERWVESRRTSAPTGEAPGAETPGVEAPGVEAPGAESPGETTRLRVSPEPTEGSAASRIPSPSSEPPAELRPESRTASLPLTPTSPTVPGLEGPSLRPGDTIRAPVSEIAAIDLLWEDGFDLLLSLQQEFDDLRPCEPERLTTQLYQLLLELGHRSGRSENPLERLEALISTIARELRGGVSSPGELTGLLPAAILEERAASPLGWCVLALALADRTRDLRLEPVICAGHPGLRYENGAHRYIVSPTATDRVLSDREFSTRIGGAGSEVAIRSLTRSEFWGHVLTDAGIDRMRAGSTARGLDLVERGLLLDPRQPSALIAQADAQLERRQEREALASLDRAVAIDAAASEPRRRRAHLLASLGEAEACGRDLQHLATDPGDPLDVIRYSRWLHARGDHRGAHHRLTPLLTSFEPQTEIGTATRRLLAEVESGPWARLLRDGASDRDRLRAVRRLGTLTTPEARTALIEALADRNGHLANAALTALRRSTGHRELGRDPAEWRRVLDLPPEESAAAP